jgi:hypothetical protein
LSEWIRLLFAKEAWLPTQWNAVSKGSAKHRRNSGVWLRSYVLGIRWHGIRGFGNFLRHEYDGIELDLLWIMVERDLPPLKIAVKSALESLLTEQSEG